MTLVVLDDVRLDRNFDLILNMETTSNIMILGIKEYRELCKISAGFFISGGILAIYNMDGDSALAFCNTLKRYKRLGTFKDDVENERLILNLRFAHILMHRFNAKRD